MVTSDNMTELKLRNSEQSTPTRSHINNSLHLARKYVRIFICGQYLLRGEANSFSRAKLVQNCEILLNEKYLSIFSRQMGPTVFIIPQIFLATRVFFSKLGILQFSRGKFSHVTRLDQSGESENI